MNKHRLVQAEDTTVFSFDPPFSSFEYVDGNYGKANDAIRRLFSLARSQDLHTVMLERIEPTGIIADENEEIASYAPDHEMKALHRISFWQSRLTAHDASACRDEDCFGYAILKHDTVPSKGYDGWHVFEAVFKKYPHIHNCVPRPMQYSVTLGGKRLQLEGLLYAQQNELNKSCAQVALRSLISRIKRSDVSYRQINDLARKASPQDFDPAGGLSVKRIRAVLNGFGIGFRDFDYTQHSDDERKQHPYQKYVYAGVESGMGALVGFRFTGPAIHDDRGHIIPFYGHTFNKDTWAPEADIAYFHVGEELGYVPSERWTSSFLGHDDNFGPNFCVPRLYIRPDQVEYVVEFLKPGIEFGGGQAEALALQFLYSVLGQIDTSQNAWLERLAHYARLDIQLVVLRAIAIDREEYINHLSSEQDWGQNPEDELVIGVLRQLLPHSLWVVEVSIPQLFPANERKLGDIVLDGGLGIDATGDTRAHFVLARVPSLYCFSQSDASDSQDFLIVPSNLVSHFPLIHLK